MTISRITKLPLAIPNVTGLPRVVDYQGFFADQPSLLGWFDFSRSGDVAVVGGGVESVTARIGSLSMTQSSSGNRPTYDALNGRLVFNSASTQFMTGVGDFPTTDVTIAAVVRRAATSTSTEGLIGSTSPTSGQHNITFRSNGNIRFTVKSTVDSTFEEPFEEEIANNEEVLVLADYSQSTDAARCRIGLGSGGTGFTATGDITMNTSWFVGALTSAGGSPCDVEISDLFIFNQAHIGTDIADVIAVYASDLKGVTG